MRVGGRHVLLLAGLACSAVLSACGAGGVGGAATAAAPGGAVREICASVPAGARRPLLTAADGTRLGGVLLGGHDAPLAVVVSRGTSEAGCDWADFSRRIADRGARVLVLDRRGTGASEGDPAALDVGHDAADVAAAGAWLSAGGRRPLVLLASAQGAIGALAASARPPAAAVCAVAVVSPVTRDVTPRADLDALAAAPAPRTVWVAHETSDDEVVADATRVLDRARRTRGVLVRELPVRSDEDGERLVAKDLLVRRFLLAAVRDCTSPPGTARARPGLHGTWGE